MKKTNWISVLGILTTIGGFLIGQLGNWIDEKKTEEMVEEKVNAALAAREEQESK